MKTWLRNFLKLLSLVFCIVPPMLATLHFFPAWYRENRFEIVLPAAAIVCFCFCAIPLVKWLAAKIKTPSALMVWWIMFFVLVGLERIIGSTIIISFIGAIGNTVGAVLWKIASKGEDEK